MRGLDEDDDDDKEEDVVEDDMVRVLSALPSDAIKIEIVSLAFSEKNGRVAQFVCDRPSASRLSSVSPHDQRPPCDPSDITNHQSRSFQDPSLYTNHNVTSR